MNQAKPQKRLLNFEDLRKFEFLSNPVVSEQSGLIAYVVKCSESNEGTLPSAIYLTDRSGLFDLPVSRSAFSSSYAPVFSKNGADLFFLSDKSGFPQIYRLDLRSFDPRSQKLPAPIQQTSLRYGVEAFDVRPDGKELAFSAPLYEEDPLCFPELTSEEKADFEWQKKHLPKYISELMYKFDSCYGLIDGSHTQIGTSPVISDFGKLQEPHILTRDRFSYDAPVYTPDGKHILCSAHPYGHKDGMKTCLYRLSDTETSETELTLLADETRYQGSALAFCPGSSDIFYSFTATHSDDTLFNSELYRLSDKNFLSCFPDDLPCDGIEPLHVGITENGSHSPMYQASSDGHYFYFESGWNQMAHVYRLDLKQKVIEKITEGHCSVTEFSILSEHELVVLMTTETSPLDLYLYDTIEKTYTLIRRHNTWLEEIELCNPEVLTLQTEDPNMPVQGFFCPPARRANGQKYPAFHYIHGGPEAFYAVGFDFEIQMLAASGLGVLYCNPRGSAGFGPEFVREQFSYDGTAYKDLMDFTDLVLKTYDYIDPDSLGIGGGSHGGWMTNYIMGHTDRFRAAVNQRTWSNPSTSYGTGDLGFYSQSTQGADNFMEYMLNRAKKSTIKDVDKFKTPCLLLHGERDLRCSLEQSEQVFSHMKVHAPEVPVRMVVFPGENHGVSRIGKIHWQIAHLREMVEWILKYTSASEEKPSANEKEEIV